MTVAKKATKKATKKVKSTKEKLVSKLNMISPRTESKGKLEARMSSDGMLSGVKYSLSTGIDPVDDATGGVPFGRVTEVYGLDQSGKTALAMRLAINAQRGEVYKGVKKSHGQWSKIPRKDYEMTVLYIDNEQSLDDDEKITVEGETLDAVVTRCDTVDQVFKICDTSIKMLEEVEKDTGVMQLLVIVVDTIAGTASQEELAAEWGKVDYSRSPKQLREGFRKLMRKINRRNVCMICTNQVSDSFKAKTPGKFNNSSLPRDEDFSTSGGRALKFFARLRIFIARTRECKLVPGTKFPDGFIAHLHVTKNSQRKPNRECRLILLYEGGMNNTYSILEHLIYMGLIKYDSNNKAYAIRFKHHKIPLKTFGETDDADEDDAPKRRVSKRKAMRSDPRISCYGEWPAFYAEHKEDCDALIAKSFKLMYDAETMTKIGSDEDDDDDDDDDDFYEAEFEDDDDSDLDD